MEKSLHHIADLSAMTRSTVEGLLGHPLHNDDVVYIATLGLQPELQSSDRNAAWDELESILVDMHRNAAKSGLSSEQIDALVDAEYDAVRHARPT